MTDGVAAARSREVVARAHALGFDAVAVTRADVSLEEEHARLVEWLGEGRHGTMRWLEEGAEARRRLDGEAVLPGARSVVCVARRYRRDPSEEAEDPPLARRLARYARGQDYHNVLRKKLRRLAVWLRGLEPGAAARPLLDEEPVLERAWAARAGLGFIGKNGMLIVPGLGSMVLLGEVVTSVVLAPTGERIPERCGACTACLDACPTDAFVRPFVLDARRCVSYLTIEHRGEIDPALEPRLGSWIFGCDDCQTACPFNASGRRTRDVRPFEPLPRWRSLGLADLLRLGAPGGPSWQETSLGTPLHRATAEGLARNAAVALGNGPPDAEARAALEAAAASHPSSVVRHAAARAAIRLRDKIHSKESCSRSGE
jgi:epoxyqueuosine reductase